MVDGRVPPQAIEIERSILGTCLTDSFSFEQIKELVSGDTFYMNTHKEIFNACLRFDKPDIILVGDELRERNKLDMIGGENYLIDLTRDATPIVEEYCQILTEKKIKRDAITSASEILRMAYNGVDAYELIDAFSKKSVDIGSQSGMKYSLRPSEIVERDKSTPKAEKLFLGLSQLDYGIYEHAMRRGQTELTIADSGHGKTQYALFKVECLLRRGFKVAWFQLEGTDSETAEYVISSTQNYDNMYICDSLYDIEEIKRECRRLNREHGIDYAVFDYVQNIECNQNISKVEKTEYISKQVTRLAKELNMISHPLSQVTINYTARTGWKQEPNYGDVRWSQQLKQDASIITSIFRPLKVDTLVVNDVLVKNWNDESVPYDSVFVKQAKVRHGRQNWKRLHMIHTDSGLKPYADETRSPF